MAALLMINRPRAREEQQLAPMEGTPGGISKIVRGVPGGDALLGCRLLQPLDYLSALPIIWMGLPGLIAQAGRPIWQAVTL